MSTSPAPAGPEAAIARRVFGFEADFAGDLRCLPMAVRRKLDLAGVKLKLPQWHGLLDEERQRLLAWDDDPAALAALARWLLARSAELPGGPAGSLPPASGAPWQQGQDWPEAVLASCAQLDLAIRSGGWGDLDELQRFALVKLSHPGHEHRNLPRALAEFGLLA
ncbi:MAG: nitrate reductase associated protein [Cyanobium sp.]